MLKKLKIFSLIISMFFALVFVSGCDSFFDKNKEESQFSQGIDSFSLEQDSRLELTTSRFKNLTETNLFGYVGAMARNLSKLEYKALDRSIPTEFVELDYEQYRSIRFRPEVALWRGESLFEVQLFHPGFIYRELVQIHILQDTRIETLSFDKNLFRYEGTALSVADIVDPGLGYAGFRVHYPLNDNSVMDEVVVFLGASYFRLLGQGHVYGLSSRGLAIDVGVDSAEEFPIFREFWLVKPKPAETKMTFYALLDSPSVVGAYRFELEPGLNTVLDVDANLYARKDVSKIGIAPLSSMFLYGQNRVPMFDDFRPEIHDSDGLLMYKSNDEWIWRPLSNGPEVKVTSLRDNTPHGFGLLQRDRSFDNYLDLETNYHRRPSEWVEIGDGDWGSGGVELLTFSTDSEFTDNIAAYWVPDKPFASGEERNYQYRLISFDNRLEIQTLAQVERTRIGWDALPGENNPPPNSQRRFIVDFKDGELRAPSNLSSVNGVLETSTGQVSDLVIQPLPNNNGWRASFRLVPAGNKPAEMNLYLALEDQRLSETWNYIWYPDRVR